MYPTAKQNDLKEAMRWLEESRRNSRPEILQI
jgi:hypothetical protein